MEYVPEKGEGEEVFGDLPCWVFGACSCVYEGWIERAVDSLDRHEVEMQGPESVTAG